MDVLEDLDETIEKGNLKTNSLGRFEIWYNKKMIVLMPNFNGEKIIFVITAYKQRKE
jgi:hypothetical protein